jgi:hypothetical protein
MKNLGRTIFLNEILVNFLRNTDEYSDEAIEQKASELLKLQNKKDISGVLTSEEKRKLNRLNAFFKSSFGISFETGNLIYPKFLKKYEMAKAAIDFKKRAYDNVVKKYIQLANKGSNYNEEDYLKFINYLKKKLVIAKSTSGIQDTNNKLSEFASIEQKNFTNVDEKPLEIKDVAKTEFSVAPILEEQKNLTAPSNSSGTINPLGINQTEKNENTAKDGTAGRYGTGRDGTGRDVTGRYVTGNNVIANNGTGRDGTGRDVTGSNRTGSNGTESNRTGNNVIANNGTGRDGTGRDVTGRYGTGRDVTGRYGTGRDGTRRDGTGRDVTGNNVIANNGTGRDVTGNNVIAYNGTGNENENKIHKNKLSDFIANIPPPVVLMGGDNNINNPNRTNMNSNSNTNNKISDKKEIKDDKDVKDTKNDIIKALIKKHTDFNINKFIKEEEEIKKLINNYIELLKEEYDPIIKEIETTDSLTYEDIEKKLTYYKKCDSLLKNFKTNFEKINIDLGISNESQSSSNKTNKISKINLIEKLIGNNNDNNKDLNNRNFENLKKILEDIKNTIETKQFNNGLMFDKNISTIELYYNFEKSSDEIKQIKDLNNDDCIDIIECLNKVIYNYTTILNELTIFYNTHTKKITELIADIDKKNKETLQIKNNMITGKNKYGTETKNTSGGSINYEKLKLLGGSNYKPSDSLSKIGDLKKFNEDMIKKIKDIYDKIGKYLLRIKNQTDIDVNPIKKTLEMRNKDVLKEYESNDPVNANNSIFYKAWNKYTTDIKKGDKIKEEIDDNLYNDIKVNDLDPKEVLSLTMQDRGIFTIVVFFIRIASLNIVEYFIDSGKIKDITYALLFYVIIYITILIILILFVNIDTYKMRILFNYLNFHTNSYGIYIHIISLIIFTYLVYTLIININFPIPNLKQDYISESDKIKLSYRLEILTMIIFLFIAIIALLI